MTRDLTSLGHRVVGIDGSMTMARAAAEHPDAHGPVLVADAAHLPLQDGAADLVVAFMSFQDVDDFAAAIAEAARVLRPGGVLVMAIVHPVNSVGQFLAADGDQPRPYLITEDYFTDHRTADRCERRGLGMTFHSAHRPLSAYTEAMYDAGLLIERLREPTDVSESTTWARLPMFLHLRAIKPPPSRAKKA